MIHRPHSADPLAIPPGRRLRAAAARPRPAELPLIHGHDCRCGRCEPPAAPALSIAEIARWSLAGCLTGNVLAFAAAPHAAWHALAGAVAQLVGAR